MIDQIETNTTEKILHRIETGGFLITERQHQPNSLYASHNHELAILGIVYQGSFTEIIGRKSQECIPYSLQLLPVGEQHTYKFNETSVRCLTIEIKPQRLEEINRFAKKLDQPIYLRKEMTVPAKRLYKELRLQDSASVLILEGMLFDMLGNAARLSTRYRLPVEPKWLRQVKDFVYENARQGISLTDAADLVEVHPTYLARLFRKFYHCSIGDYVRNVRIDYAVQELSTTDKPLSEIALNAGFYDQSHFTLTFKLCMKMTPGEFRSIQSSQTCTSKLQSSNMP